MLVDKNNLSEGETAIDMAKKQLDQLGVKYEMSDNKFKPFKVIYKPINKSDKFYDEFEDIVDLFNLKGVVKSSMSENTKSNPEVDKLLKVMNTKKAGSEYKKALMDLIAMAEKKSGKTVNTKKEALLALDYIEPTIREAKEEDKVDTITMDVPLFIRMLEYSREDAAADVDLHDVTEKANKLGKERGILQMEDYDEIVGATEEIKEGELTEANIPSNIRDFAKRKGVLPLVNKVAKWAEAVGARIAGGTAIGKNYSTLVLDLDYKQQGEVRIDTDYDTITLFDEPVRNFNEFQRVYSDGQGFNLEEIASKVLSKLKESKSTPCWKGYEQIGMKEKDGRQVPNCVPKK
jgi:hypothetical protein